MTRHLKSTRQTCAQWYCLKVKSDKCDTWDGYSNDHDNTCATVLTNFCVSMINVHIARTTWTNLQNFQNKIAIMIYESTCQKKTVGPTSEKEARHIEGTHGITFSAYKHAFYWRQNDITMISNTSSYTTRCTSKGCTLLTILTLEMIMHPTEFACGSDILSSLGFLVLLLNSLGMI